MNDFNNAIYNPEFDLTGPHLVAASAGTGKTYNIQNIYARLIAEKGFLVSQIQVMTFTEPSTHELRDRIRKILTIYSSYLSNGRECVPEGDRDRIEKLWGCARATIDGDDNKARGIIRGRIELALMQFDQASISTIHGFCRRILSRFAFETNSAFNAELEDRKKYDLGRLARDWWRNKVNNEDKLGNLVALDGLTKTLTEISQKNGWSIDEAETENSVLRIAKELLSHYEEERSGREVQSFDDLLKALCDALCDEAKGDALASILRDEYKAALVDEFQDTDAVQYEIFRRIFLDVPDEIERPALFFVGDPKQAIYAFRGGDIFTYRKAATRTDLKDGNTYQLTKNFRSTPKLIDAVNLIFRDFNGNRTFGDDTIPYDDDLIADDKNEPIILEDGRPDPTPFRVLLTEGSDERVRAVVDSVLGILNENIKPKITPKDIAILSTSHKNIEQFAKALRKEKVPVVIQKSGNVFASQIAKEFHNILRAMALIGGRGQVKAALLTSFFETKIESLIPDNDDDDLANAIAFFTSINHVWLKKGFRAAFSTFEASDFCKMRERFANMKNGERLLADILQIVDLATEASLRLGPSPEMLVDWLVDRLNKADNDESQSDEYARELESESDAVRLMTTYVSKGLQFPVVIVPLAATKSHGAPYFYHKDNEFYVSTSEDAKANATKENSDEQTRLLYVAFTRAKKRTVVIGPISEMSPNKKLCSLLSNAAKNANVELSDKYPLVLGSIRLDRYSKTADLSYMPPANDIPSLVKAKIPRRYSTKPIRGSYSSLTPTSEIEVDDGHDYDDSDVKMIDEVSGNDIFSVPGGAKTGTCWHEILEKVPFDISDAELRKQVELSMRLHGLTTGDDTLFSSRIDIVTDMMKKTLDYGLNTPNGDEFSLRDIALTDRISEWEFDFSSKASVKTTEAIAKILKEEWKGLDNKRYFLEALEGWNRPIPKGYLKGFIDLLFRHNGKYYIVDWKSNSLNLRRSSFCEEGINIEMASAGYFFQYLLYSVVLHRFLKEQLGEAYSWEENFGGVRYYFLRGIAAEAEAPVFVDRPSEQLLDRLSIALGLEDK